MAIFHLSAQVIGRSAGRSATAAAAYRAGCKITDARTGELSSEPRRSGVRETFILAPENAPLWVTDRSSLWNRAELAEKRKDAQVAREVEVSLPAELPHEVRKRLLIDFCNSQFVAAGMVVDVAMHAPGREGDRRNEHAHILLTLRNLEAGGFGPKNRDWNRVELLENWRQRWATLVNERLAAAGIEGRVDHRTLEAQGIDRPPTEHLGPAASSLERRGVSTVRGELVSLLNEREQVVIELAKIRQQQEQAEFENLPLEDLQRLAARPATIEERMVADPRLSIARGECDRERLQVDTLKRRMLAAKRGQAQADLDALAWRERHRVRAWLHDQRVLAAKPLEALARARAEAYSDQARIRPEGLAALDRLRNMERKYEALQKTITIEHEHKYETDVRRADRASAEIARREGGALHLQPQRPVPRMDLKGPAPPRP